MMNKCQTRDKSIAGWTDQLSSPSLIRGIYLLLLVCGCRPGDRLDLHMSVRVSFPSSVEDVSEPISACGHKA